MKIKIDGVNPKRWKKNVSERDLEFDFQDDFLRDLCSIRCTAYFISLRKCKDGYRKVKKVGLMRGLTPMEVSNIVSGLQTEKIHEKFSRENQLKLYKGELIGYIKLQMIDGVKQWSKNRKAVRVLPLKYRHSIKKARKNLKIPEFPNKC